MLPHSTVMESIGKVKDVKKLPSVLTSDEIAGMVECTDLPGGLPLPGAVDSAKVKLPDPKAFITLKKGNFDDVACKKYPDRCKKGGQGYVEGTAVNDLQDNVFIKLRFSPKSKADGDFGEHTERIIKEFQQCALEKKRKKDGRKPYCHRCRSNGDS
jgi:hypothetical protein